MAQSVLLRWFLLAEAAVFGTAALIHSGVLMHGHEHGAARTAETLIGFVLLAGWVGCVIAPPSSRGIGLAAQAFALLGTAVGIVTIIIGVGPHTALDLTLHAGMVLLLAAGLLVAGRQEKIPTSRVSGR